tara:strand:- start:14859 stop:15317 length:459 start_codon:yes stop_codon:yes gene_type:complete
MIKLSKMADYGVILMVQLARKPALVTTASALAEATGLPVPTVSKLLKLLSRAGLLESRRGTKGGYAISRPLTVVTVADIVSAVEGPIALTECMTAEGTVCEIEALCPTRSNWRQINHALITALDNVSLAEMAKPILFPPPIESATAVAEAIA